METFHYESMGQQGSRNDEEGEDGWEKKQEKVKEKEVKPEWQVDFEEAVFTYRLEVELGNPPGQIPMSQVWRMDSIKKVSEDGTRKNVKYGKYSAPESEKTRKRKYIYESQEKKVISFTEN